jgi:hypothetical protein
MDGAGTAEGGSCSTKTGGQLAGKQAIIIRLRFEPLVA